MPLGIRPATLAIRVACDGTPSEALLAQLDALVEAHPTDLDLRFARACCLEELGRESRARGAYQSVLARAPAHFGALTNLGTLYFTAGEDVRARVLYEQAVRARPDDPVGHVNVGNVLAELGDPSGAVAAYERALELAPEHPTAHFALAVLYAAAGDGERASAHRDHAFARPIVYVAPYHGGGAPREVLQLLAAQGGNIVTTLLFDDRSVRVTTLVADSWRSGVTLPEHDLLFNAIGDADRADDALANAIALAASSSAPVVNDPRRVLETGRARIARRLANIPGVVAPRTELLDRDGLDAAALRARGFRFPLLLRAPGHHMGDRFELLGDPDDLPGALERLAADELFAIEYLDARGTDGQVRKYRVLFIDGELLPLHLAISAQWKVHYFSADMRDRSENRAEEAAFLADMRGTLGPTIVGALERIRDTLGLDYGGIDFGVSRAGELLLFEANATMAIFLPEGDERFAYRRPPIEQAIAAARRMIQCRVSGVAGRAAPPGS